MKQPHDRQEIAQLLSRFMAGETSVAEEQLLAHYFRTHDVPEEWAEYKQMFALFDSGEVDIEPGTASPEPLHGGASGRPRMLPKAVRVKPRIIALRWGMAAAAASVLLLLVLRLAQRTEEGTAEFYVGKAVSKLQTPPPTPPLEGRGVPAESLAANKAAAAPLPSRGGAGVGSVITVEEVPAVQYTASVGQPTPQPAKRKATRKKSLKAPKAPPSAPEGATIDHSHLTAHKTIEAPSGAVGGAPGAVGGASSLSQDPFLLAAAQTQDIRSRGERLHREIAQLMNNP